MSYSVICFGEMLWDCFPDGEMPGGAPMNVALHLKQLGVEVQLISKVGNDPQGKLLLAFIEDYQLPKDFIQIDPQRATGQVIIDVTDKENIAYEIVSPVAWDEINLTKANNKQVSEADALVFGSLSVRNDTSWETLQALVQHDVIKIFDLNLRSPFINFDKIDYLLRHTCILKINEDELEVLAKYFELDNTDDLGEKLCIYLTRKYGIHTICITLGSKGAMLYKNKNFYKHEGYKVQVKDTVGAGDAFLSGFIKTYLEEQQPIEILDFACKLGAFVASKRGGTPKYSIRSIQQIQ